jgi:hypothetical protein
LTLASAGLTPRERGGVAGEGGRTTESRVEERAAAGRRKSEVRVREGKWGSGREGTSHSRKIQRTEGEFCKIASGVRSNWGRRGCGSVTRVP